MRRLCKYFGVLIIGALPFISLFAANTDTVTVSFIIVAVDEIAFSGDPAVLSAGPGMSDSDNTTTYDVTTNGVVRRITGRLDANMPVGVTLSSELDPPTGATSLGAVNLTTVDQNLVINISNVAEAGLGVEYVLDATAIAAPAPLDTRILTYTLTP